MPAHETPSEGSGVAVTETRWLTQLEGPELPRYRAYTVAVPSPEFTSVHDFVAALFSQAPPELQPEEFVMYISVAVGAYVLRVAEVPELDETSNDDGPFRALETVRTPRPLTFE